jgi:HAD superfamily hydrolase (TIGR01509 family)
MTPEALIFDVDGTLADTEEVHRTAFNCAFEAHGLPWQWNTGEYRELLAIAGGRERIGAYIDMLDLDAAARARLKASIPDLHDTKTRIYTRLLRSEAVKLRDGVPELIESATRHGVRLAIATTTSVLNVEALLTRHLGQRGLERFAVIGAGDGVARKKPAPDIYLKVLRQLDSEPHACIAFEDSAIGLRAAQAAGLFTVVTPSEWTRHEDLSRADLLLTSLREFKLESAKPSARARL